MSSVMLMCAVVASLAVGVLVAQGLCAVMFRVFRMHVQQVATAKVAQAAAVGTLQG